MIIILHSREERKKCTLSQIRNDPSFTFYHEDAYKLRNDPFLLHPEGQSLSHDDRGHELVLLDATWSNFRKLLNRDPVLDGLEKRSINGYFTAYPRKSRKGPYPEHYLASIEVIIAAGFILGIAEYSDVLKKYYFRDQFIKKNGLHLSDG